MWLSIFRYVSKTLSLLFKVEEHSIVSMKMYEMYSQQICSKNVKLNHRLSSSTSSSAKRNEPCKTCSGITGLWKLISTRGHYDHVKTSRSYRKDCAGNTNCSISDFILQDSAFVSFHIYVLIRCFKSSWVASTCFGSQYCWCNMKKNEESNYFQSKIH